MGSVNLTSWNLQSKGAFFVSGGLCSENGGLCSAPLKIQRSESLLFVGILLSNLRASSQDRWNVFVENFVF